MKIFLSILMVLGLIGIVLVLTKNENPTQIINENNVTMVEGKQIVDLTARGGYSPRKSVAKAGVPTILRFTTNGNYDCSSSVRIPSMNISKTLELSGTTEIDLGNPNEGLLQGSCAMGMYPFEINFQN